MEPGGTSESHGWAMRARWWQMVGQGGSENPQSGRQVASVTYRQLPPPPWGAASEKRCPVPHERNILSIGSGLAPWAGSLIHFKFISSLKLNPWGGNEEGAEKAVRSHWGECGDSTPSGLVWEPLWHRG